MFWDRRCTVDRHMCAGRAATARAGKERQEVSRRSKMSSCRHPEPWSFARALRLNGLPTRAAVVIMTLVVVLSASVSVWSQTLSGTLRVEVSDSTGALVPDAKVTVTNEATHVSVTLARGDSGLYTFPS